MFYVDKELRFLLWYISEILLHRSLGKIEKFMFYVDKELKD
jgi:hypothetical protein